jgi:hypothetical protein
MLKDLCIIAISTDIRIYLTQNFGCCNYRTAANSSLDYYIRIYIADAVSQPAQIETTFYYQTVLTVTLNEIIATTKDIYD